MRKKIGAIFKAQKSKIKIPQRKQVTIAQPGSRKRDPDYFPKWFLWCDSIHVEKLADLPSSCHVH